MYLPYEFNFTPQTSYAEFEPTLANVFRVLVQVRVQGCFPESISEPAQEWHLVPPGRSRASSVRYDTGRHYLRQPW